MRFGVFPAINKYGGGVYQYSLTLLEALQSLQQNGLNDEVVLFFDNDTSTTVPPLITNMGWPCLPIQPPSATEPTKTSGPSLSHSVIAQVARRMVGEGPHREAWRRIRDYVTPGWRPPPPVSFQELLCRNQVRSLLWMRHWLTKHGIEFMIYPVPVTFSFESSIPFVMAIHDLQHRLQPEFPEVSAEGEWEYREYLFRNAARYATLLLADSEVGKEDILRFYEPYGVRADRIKVLPFLPAHYLAREVDKAEVSEVLASLGLSRPYLFYPAQFWPHKNHVRIVQALGQLKSQSGLDIDLVLVGGAPDKWRRQVLDEVMQLVRELGLTERVHYLGYVPEDKMATLYVGARALIMPTFFGPTNIPPLEAWSLGCPVITSDIRGIREQMGDAAVLVNPRSVESIAAGIAQVWCNEGLRQELVVRGRKRLASYTPEDFRRRLADILAEAKERVRLGDTPVDTVFSEKGLFWKRSSGSKGTASAWR